MLVVQGLLLFGLGRMAREFGAYRRHYAEITARLRDKVRQQTVRQGTAHGRSTARGAEPRLISVLKPREHQGWDAKKCEHCHKAIELTADVCQHCGHEQNSLLLN